MTRCREVHISSYVRYDMPNKDYITVGFMKADGCIVKKKKKNTRRMKNVSLKNRMDAIRRMSLVSNTE